MFQNIDNRYCQKTSCLYSLRGIALGTPWGLFTRFLNCNEGGSKSILDYGLVDSSHLNYVTSFTIDKEARFDCGSDHALLVADVRYGRKNSITWRYNDALQFNITPSTNFKAYQEECFRQSITFIWRLIYRDAVISHYKLYYRVWEKHYWSQNF